MSRDRQASLMLTRRNLLRLAAAGTVLPSSRAAQARPRDPAHQDEPSRPASAPGATSLSRQFGRWVAALRYEDLPAPVIDRAKGLTLHGLASALLGSQLPAGQQVMKLIVDE